MEFEKTIGKVEELMRKGHGAEQIREELKATDEDISIARAAIRNKKEEKVDARFVFNEEDFRFATNRLVAEYRAKRLACNTLLEIGCGIGSQTMAFAKSCNKVVAIDNDERKVRYAKQNAKIGRAKNVDFIQDDAIRALEKINWADIIFWDPQRMAKEEERSLGSLMPVFDELMKRARRITKRIAVELPPQIESRKAEGCELEYISVDGALNRLTAYYNGLMRARTSAVALPSGARIEAGEGEKLISATKALRYIYEVDKAVQKALLLSVLAKKVGEKRTIMINKEAYLTSDRRIRSPFLKRHRVIGECKIGDVNELLRKRRIGKAVLRGGIAEREYWRMRREIERGLKGSAVSHVFIADDRAMITRRE